MHLRAPTPQRHIPTFNEGTYTILNVSPKWLRGNYKSGKLYTSICIRTLVMQVILWCYWELDVPFIAVIIKLVWFILPTDGLQVQ